MLTWPANLGFIIGPALAGFLATTVLQETLPVLIAIFISVVAVLLIIFYLPESKPLHIRENPEQLNVRKIFGQEQTECIDYDDSGKIKLKQVLNLKYLPYIILLYFLIYLGFSIFYTAFPIHAAQGLSWSVKELGVFFAFLSFMMILVQGPILNFLSKHVSEAILVISGNLILGTNFVLLTFHETAIVYLAAVFFAVGNGLMWPSLLSILSKVAGEKYQGSVQGFASSFGSLASIIGLIVGGFLYGLLGAAAFFLSAGIIYVIFLLSFRLLFFRSEQN
jgi:MFS family permease